jgi:hypothetical protein
MTPAEFAWALVAGHGRALQYIKEHGDSRPEIRAALMNACTSCPSIDPQSKHPSLVPLAEWVIHFNPCCICREGAIEFLAGVGSLTPELATESQYDAVRFD